MPLLSDATAWLNDTLASPDVAGVSVIYSRGTYPAVSVNLTDAVVGRTVFRQVADFDSPGAAIVWGERDYLIRAESLVLGGIQTLPQRGDKITEVIKGTTLIFEVFEPGDEPCWRYSDVERTLLRIHVKRVA